VLRIRHRRKMQPRTISSAKLLGEALIMVRTFVSLLLITTMTFCTFGCRSFSSGSSAAGQSVLELAVEPGFLEVPWRIRFFPDGRVIREIGTADKHFEKRRLQRLKSKDLQHLLRVVGAEQIFRQPSEHPDAGDRPVLSIRFREANLLRERFVVRSYEVDPGAVQKAIWRLVLLRRSLRKPLSR
jgi:hypothetical protein